MTINYTESVFHGALYATQSSRRVMGAPKVRVVQLTAIEPSSANTNSCGGEGSLFGRGGETTGGGATSLVAFFALRKMGASF